MVAEPKGQNKSQDGQAMVEFALTLPILLLFIVGIINFGIVLFSYSNASNQLRSALRYSEIMGYYTDAAATKPYLDCAKMTEVAQRGWYASDQNVTITYEIVSGPYKNQSLNCASYSTADLKTIVNSGDVLHIDLTANVKLLFLPIGPLQLKFSGERSIMFSVDVDPVTP